MSAEINMYESQIRDYKYDIENLARELQEVKKKYFMQMKKERALKERERAMGPAGVPVPPTIQPQKTDQARFTGGGFNLSKAKAWGESSHGVE